MIASKQPLLVAAQGSRWSNQRFVAATAQIFLLCLSIGIISNILINVGERKIQENWATQRYSELQAAGSFITDKVTSQAFKTQMFASSELLNNYLLLPSYEQQKQLQKNWQILVDNIPELLDIALFNSQGRFQLSTNEHFKHINIPNALLGEVQAIGGNEIFTSQIELIPIAGQLEPYLYQLVWLENPDQTIRGHLVTFNSMSNILNSIRPAYSSQNVPLIMLDSQGLIYAGVDTVSSIKHIPNTIGGALHQSHPELWQKISTGHYGQYHDKTATYVYLKIELTTNKQTPREYFLLSYIPNQLISTQFSSWRNTLITIAIILMIIGSTLIILLHLYHLEQRSRLYSIALSNRLFNRNIGCLIVNNNWRVIAANKTAITQLDKGNNGLIDRNIQRILQLSDDRYREVVTTLNALQIWQGEIVVSSEEKQRYRLTIDSKEGSYNRYFVITIDDISALKAAQYKAKIDHLLAQHAMPTTLLSADGTIIQSNNEFITQIVATTQKQQLQLTELLAADISEIWPQICQQILLQGHWKGQVKTKKNIEFTAHLKGYLDSAGEIEYIVATLEPFTSSIQFSESGELLPHRSTILINRCDLESYFNNLTKQSKEQSSLLLFDISNENILSYMSNIDQLESRQKEVEILLLKDLPAAYQMSHLQLGKLIMILPNTDADTAHYFAIKSLKNLQSMGLDDGIFVGIATYHIGLSLEQYIANAEVALQRAKQIGDQRICQAYTRGS